jgi:hypothetical protein
MRFIELLEKVEMIELRDGGKTPIILDPTRHQFNSFIKTFESEQARIIVGDRHMLMGNHWHSTHGDLVNDAGNLFGVNFPENTMQGWANTEHVLFWGNGIASENSLDELVKLNHSDWLRAKQNPIFARIFIDFPIGFTVNDGLMILFPVNGDAYIDDINMVMQN